MTTALEQAEKKLADLLLEQKAAYDSYTQRQTGETYSLILKLKKQVAKAKIEVARNK